MSVSCDIVQIIRIVREFETMMHQLHKWQIRYLAEATESICVEALYDDWDASICGLLNSLETVFCKSFIDFLDDVDIVLIQVPLWLLQLNVESRSCSDADFPLVIRLQEFHLADGLIKGWDLEQTVEGSTPVNKALFAFYHL